MNPEIIEKLKNKTLTVNDLKNINIDELEVSYDDQDRSSLLPSLFKFQGKPYSIDDYPQFKGMYSAEYVPDSLWMTGRQVSKTMNLSRSEVLDCITIDNFQIVYISPLKPQALRYSALYLNEAISTCPRARRFQIKPENSEEGPMLLNNLMHRTFTNGAGIQLTYAKTESDRARGIFADRLDFDEIQDQLIDNIPIVTQSLTQSMWGLRRFTGTARTVDNTIEWLWKQSCQYEWTMKCSGCNHYNTPTVENKVLDMIQYDGPHCTKCGKLLNVREGKFIATYPEREKTFAGYHIPQIVVPAIVENPVKWSRLLNSVLKYPLSHVYQEILGISYNVGSRLITPEDIEKVSVLPSVTELQNKLKDYVFTVGGVDWGIAEQTSFSVHTVIGLKPDGKIHVLWAKRFTGVDPDTLLREIAKTHKYYMCDLICCDFGMGFDLNVMLETRFGLPVIQIQYTSQNQFLNYNPILGHSRWTVDKCTALDTLFWSIKYGGILFPPVSEFEVFTRDLLSPYEHVSEASGFQRKRWLRNPNMPDDFTHALCFATLGGMKLAGHSALAAVPENTFDGSNISSGTPVFSNEEAIDFLNSIG